MRTVIRYFPVESVTASKLFPFASLRARTTTPGSTPPVWSETVPLIAASWAKAFTGSKNRSAKSAERTSQRNENSRIEPSSWGASPDGGIETWKALSRRRLYHKEVSGVRYQVSGVVQVSG